MSYCPIGELMGDDLTKAWFELMKHLKACPQCREEFLKNKDNAALSMLLEDESWKYYFGA